MSYAIVKGNEVILRSNLRKCGNSIGLNVVAVKKCKLCNEDKNRENYNKLLAPSILLLCTS